MNVVIVLHHPDISGNFGTVTLANHPFWRHCGDVVIIITDLMKKAWQLMFVLSFLAKILILPISITCFMINSPILMLLLVRIHLPKEQLLGILGPQKNNLTILSPSHACQFHLHQGPQGHASNHGSKTLSVNQDASSALSSRPNLGPRAKE